MYCSTRADPSAVRRTETDALRSSSPSTSPWTKSTPLPLRTCTGGRGDGWRDARATALGGFGTSGEGTRRARQGRGGGLCHRQSAHLAEERCDLPAGCFASSELVEHGEEDKTVTLIHQRHARPRTFAPVKAAQAERRVQSAEATAEDADVWRAEAIARRAHGDRRATLQPRGQARRPTLHHGHHAGGGGAEEEARDPGHFADESEIGSDSAGMVGCDHSVRDTCWSLLYSTRINSQTISFGTRRETVLA